MSYQSVVLADTPVAAYFFAETSGATCADSSGNSLTGTAQSTFTRNVSSGLAGVGVGITFGAGGYVRVPDNNLLDITGAVTYEIWCFMTALPTAGNFWSLMAKGYTTPTGGYHLYIASDGSIVLNDTFQGTHVVDAPAATLTTNTLYHIVASAPASHSNVLYVNNVVVGTKTANVSTIGATAEPFCVGAVSQDGSVSQGLSQTVYAAAAYATGLSAAQVAAHWNARNIGSGGGGGASGPIGAVIAAAVTQSFVTAAAQPGKGRPAEKGPPPGQTKKQPPPPPSFPRLPGTEFPPES